MMFILQKKNRTFYTIILLFLSSCGNFVPIEPVSAVNDRFNADYGSIVAKAKRKNKESIRKSNFDGTTSFEKTAYGRLLQNEADFLEINARNNPYIEIQEAGAGHLEYLSYNSDSYFKTEKNIFDDIKIPKNDFKYYDLGEKKYNEINNIELQESYDYVVEINKERLKQIEIVRLKQEALLKEQQKNQSLAEKTKKGLKSLTEKIKDLLK